MANAFDRKNQNQHKPQQEAPKPRASKALAITGTQQKLAVALQSAQSVLDGTADGMERFSEEFSDQFAGIIEDGLTAAWQKTGQKIAQIEAPDFFGGAGASLFTLKAPKMLSSLPEAQDAITVEAIAEASV